LVEIAVLFPCLYGHLCIAPLAAPDFEDPGKSRGLRATCGRLNQNNIPMKIGYRIGETKYIEEHVPTIPAVELPLAGKVKVDVPEQET
jgi:hypothetical protein